MADTIRPAIGMTAEQRDFFLAMARQSIAAVGRAQHAVRLLEFVDRRPVPHVNAPRWLAAELRRLAVELEEGAA
jgi:hypothetical protein